VKVESIYYSQYDATPQEWKLEECTFGNINLIVGENASGKSKVLSVIGNLGDLLSGDRGLFLSANYRIEFDENGKKIDYVLRCERSGIVEEKLDVDNTTLLKRGSDGTGKIHYKKLNDDLEFQAPQNQVVSVARRDAIQHPFLGDLYDWGKSVRRYYFGTELGQHNVATPAIAKEGAATPIVNPKDTNMVVATLIDGKRKYAAKFTESIIKDMEAIGYNLTEIGAAPLISIVFQGLPEMFGVYVKEADLNGITDQNDMSQGMWRSLSLIIQITYSQLTNTPSCILIDDIGEGLDYSRSTALVKLLADKAKETPVQLIMATNDRFVMNNVPLEYWSVIQRIGNVSRIYDYRNSPDLFKEFELTGMNNFDFFSSKYYLKGTQQN